VGSTGSSSVLTGAAGTFVARAGIALGHEPAHARLAPCGEQGVRALGPQPIGLREAAVEVLEIPQTGQRGRLMDDRFGPGLEDGLAHSMRIEQVQLDRPGTQRAQAFRIPGRLERADHLMPSLNQLRDEAWRRSLPQQALASLSPPGYFGDPPRFPAPRGGAAALGLGRSTGMTRHIERM
jgi:hypothetical protein